MKKFCLVLGAISCAAGASIHDVGIDDTMLADAALSGAFDKYHLKQWKYAAQTEPDANNKNPTDWGDGTLTAATTCKTGTMQSPIDIKKTSVTQDATDVGAVMGHGLDLNLDGYLANTGRLLSWLYFGYNRPTINGGPLGTKRYALSHINFHFGSTDTKGSEHTMDGTQSPMEMQMIFYDGSFQSIKDARDSTNKDALVGVSKLFEIDTSANAELNPIINGLTNILKPDVSTAYAADTVINLEDDAAAAAGATKNTQPDVVLNLTKIIGSDMFESYYYYDGSMTTPDCTENTKWIICMDKIKISTSQLTELRKLEIMYDNTAMAEVTDKLQDNFRPVQTIGTRTVKKRTKPFTIDANRALILGASLAGIGGYAAIQELLKQEGLVRSLQENPLTDLFEQFSQSGEQRSSDVEPAYAQYQQPVYQPQQYQQYVPQPQAVAPVQ